MSLNVQLNQAVKAGDVETSKKLISDGADINIILGMQGTPLCAAISANQVDMVKFLIDMKCNLNGRDYDGETPLCLALRKNSLVAEMLIKAGCYVNREDPVTRQPPIIIATVIGLLNVVRLLIEADCDVNRRDKDGCSALHYAVKNGRFEITELLLKSEGVKVNMRNEAGDTPLLVAVRCGNMSAMKQLIDSASLNINDIDIQGFPKEKLSLEHIRNISCCDVNRRNQLDDNRPLHIAVQTNNIKAAEMLLDAGCLVSPLNFERYTPLLQACILDYRTLALMLIERGADVNVEKGSSSMSKHFRQIRTTPLIEAVKNCDLLIVQKLLECGADVNAQNYEGETPLYVGLKKPSNAESDAVVDCLLNEKDVDYLIRTYSGYSLYHALLKNNRLRYIEKLVKHGCPINSVPYPILHESIGVFEFENFIQQSIKIENLNVIIELLKQGADPNVRDEDGSTAIHVCADKCNDVEIAKWLIAYGADVNAFRGSELFPGMDYALTTALLYYNYSMAQLLIHAGCNLNSMLSRSDGIEEGVTEMKFLDTMESSPEMYQMMKMVASSPRSLFELSSLRIRNHFISNAITIVNVEKLCLPQCVKDCITLKSLFNLEIKEFSMKELSGCDTSSESD